MSTLNFKVRNDWTLAELLNHETGDTHRGSHGRYIDVVCDKNYKAGEKGRVKVSSQNATYSKDTVQVVEFTLQDIKKGLRSPKVRKAKFYEEFCRAAHKAGIRGFQIEATPVFGVVRTEFKRAYFGKKPAVRKTPAVKKTRMKSFG